MRKLRTTHKATVGKSIDRHVVDERREMLSWRASIRSETGRNAAQVVVRAVSWFAAREEALKAFSALGRHPDPGWITIVPVVTG